MNAPARNVTPASNRPALVTVDQLVRDHAHIEALAQAIEARATKMLTVLEDEEDLAFAHTFVADCRQDAARVDRARDDEKGPYREAERTIQSWFKDIENRILAAKAKVESGPVKVYLKRKEAKERAEREAEAQRLRDEADGKAATAIAAATAEAATPPAAGAAPLSQKSGLSSFAMADAASAHSRATRATAAAVAKPSELARTRTGAGTATLVDDWQFEIVDYDKIDMNTLRAQFTRADVEKAIRRHVNLHKDSEQLAGVKVWNDPKPMMV